MTLTHNHMAKNQKGTAVSIVNNQNTNVVQKQVELVVVDGKLVPDFRDTNPGVVQ